MYCTYYIPITFILTFTYYKCYYVYFKIINLHLFITHTYYYILHTYYILKKSVIFFFCEKLLVAIRLIALSNLLIALKIVSHLFSSISDCSKNLRNPDKKNVASLNDMTGTSASSNRHHCQNCAEVN